MTVAEFMNKWAQVALTERSASQQHFLDLCKVFEHPEPAAADPTGETFTFERGAAKNDGGDGWADVWKKDHFGWEYKGKHKNLDAAYQQLLQYREDLDNPPLLVVSDMDRIIVRTNFTATKQRVYEIPLTRLGDAAELGILRAVFHNPAQLKPGVTSRAITSDAARQVAEIAQSMGNRGLDPAAVAHFLNRLVFCFFAEDIRLLPAMVFKRLVDRAGNDPARFTRMIGQLFEAMAHGGDFGVEGIRHFNGNLFTSGPVLELTAPEIDALRAAARLDWSAVDASIFGTLFERGLDPAKRAQLGAHYTSREDIETVVGPVVLAPLRREWAAVKEEAERTLDRGTAKARAAVDRLLHGFLLRLGEVKVLDPACGSGNFLYVTLQLLKALEHEVIQYALLRGYSAYLPVVGPWQLYGIELNPYAFDLAQMTIWIGHLQWDWHHGSGVDQDPILRTIDQNFQCGDAVLDRTDPAHPREPEWPAVDYIVGNPPFLGDKMMRGALGDAYVDRLRAFYRGQVPGGADLCCYWFEKARRHIQEGQCQRAGLLATNSIRTGANRQVLERIAATGGIFMAWSDREWVLDGAAVRVSMVGFDGGSEAGRQLDGAPVARINTDLSSSTDVTSAAVLAENEQRCFLGMMKGGAFDLTDETAQAMLRAPLNPNGRHNGDVVKPRLGGQDVTGRPRRGWIIDFVEAPLDEAAGYELPFEYVRQHVKPLRDQNRDARMRTKWWLHGRSRPDLRRAIHGLRRCIVTPEVAKHRLFVWMDTGVVPDHKLHVFARDDDYFFGVLHSRVHEVWSLAQCSWMGVGNDPSYSSTRTFGTFPLPWAPDQEPIADARVEAIALASRELVEQRDRWLNPPDAGAADLRARTLTHLYNQRPTWLDLAHRKLDAAVCAAYGWEATVTDGEILERLLALNAQRAVPVQGK